MFDIKNTPDAAARQAVAEDSFEAQCQLLERQAQAIAEAHRNHLRARTEAHRRERFINWHWYAMDDDRLDAALAAEFAILGERMPDELSEEECFAILGRQYDRLTDAEIRAFEAAVRRENSDFYFDDQYFSDEMVAARNRWGADIRTLVDRARTELNEQYILELSALDDSDAFEQAHARHERANSELSKIAMQYQPVIFNCDACGAFSNSHDECGNLIAGVGLWALPNGETGSYMVCELCIDKPETHDALERLFDESAAYRAAHDEAFALSVPKLIEKPLEEWTEEDRREIERQVDAYVKTRMVVLVREYADARNDAQPAVSGNGSTPGSVGDQGSQPQQPSGAAAPQPGVFEFLSFDQVLNLKSKQWIVNPMLGPGDMGTLVSLPGDGKTFLGIDLTVKACQGRKFADYFDIPRPLAVAYAAGEGAAGLRDRFDAAAQAWGVTDLPNLTLIPSTPQLFADPRSRNDTIETFVTEWQTNRPGQRLDLLIVDTWHTATVGSEENSAKDTGIIIDRLRKATRTLGCAILILHHTDKNGDRYRGSSALHGAMDVMMQIKRSATDRALTCVKLKDGPLWSPRSFSIIAKGPSAVVVWGGAAQGLTAQAADLRDEVLSLFRDNPGDVFDVTLVKDSLTVPDITRQAVQRVLATLAKEKHLDAWREDPTATRGPKAKWLYRLSGLDAALSLLTP